MRRLFATTAAAPSGVLQLLVSALTPRVPAEVPRVRLDGAPLPVSVRRPWTSLRGAAPAGKRLTPGFSTLLEVPSPGSAATLRIEVDGAVADVRARPLPSTLPPPGASFNVLLVSCYHRDEDAGFRVADEARRLARDEGVDLVLHLGDQVYLDLPTRQNLPKDELALADALEQKYRDNFVPDGSNYAGVLELGPNVAMPDDHEYWNNAPHVSYFLENTWRDADRARWWRLGHDLFTGYQGFAPAPDGLPAPHLRLDVEPLSFFFANTRSHRRDDRSACVAPQTLNALRTWTAELRAQGRFGVLVTGQSLLDPKADALEGRVADYALPNYGDFPALTSAVDEVVRSAADVLLVTGDVHWGRVARLSPTSDVRGEASLYEVICSPAALCTTIGADSLKSFLAKVSGGRNPWPRHADPPVLERLKRLDGTKTPWWTQTLHRQKGDMLCLLRFSRRGDGVEVRPRYVQIGKNRVDDVKPFTLRRR
jgi:hypothetical protein